MQEKVGSFPGSGRSPEGGNSNPLLYSCLRNRMDRGSWRATAHGVTKSWTQVSTEHKKNRLYNKQVSFKVAKEEAQMDETQASLVAQKVKTLLAMQETQFRSLDQEDLLGKETAMHSSILAWKVAWTEEPGGLQSMGSQRV